MSARGGQLDLAGLEAPKEDVPVSDVPDDYDPRVREGGAAGPARCTLDHLRRRHLFGLDVDQPLEVGGEVVAETMGGAELWRITSTRPEVWLEKVGGAP